MAAILSRPQRIKENAAQVEKISNCNMQITCLHFTIFLNTDTNSGLKSTFNERMTYEKNN